MRLSYGAYSFLALNKINSVYVKSFIRNTELGYEKIYSYIGFSWIFCVC